MIKSFKIFESKTNLLLYIFDKNGKILYFNIKENEIDEYLYDENGKNRGGYGVQYDINNDIIKFKSLEEIQEWCDKRNDKELKKLTYNEKYKDLSYIALNLRKELDSYYYINRGSCFLFAKEISKLGYDKFTFIYSEEEQDIIHVYIKLSNNLYFDSEGFKNKKEIKDEYNIGSECSMFDSDINELEYHISSKDINDSLTTVPLSDDEWKIIRNIINKSELNRT